MSERESGLRRRTLLGAIGGGLTALSGCAAVAGTSRTNRLRVGTLQPPVTLDPLRARSVGSFQAITRIFDGLYTYDDGTGVVPILASGPPRVGDGEVVVAIDEAARFQNGERVTAEDVRYTFETPREERTTALPAVDAFDGVEVLDERTVRFLLDAPYPDVERRLTFPVVPRAVREDDREGFATEPVGAGPYRVESFSEEQSLALARWDDYWDEPAPAVAAVSVLAVESPITQMMGLETNRTDVIEPVSPQLHDKFRDVTNATIREREGFRSYYLGFNLNEGPATERPVREAIAACIDVEKAVTDLVEPLGERRYSILPRSVSEAWGFPVEEWRDMAVAKNTERAARLFSEANEAGGEIRILTPPDPKHKELAETLARGIRDAGHGALVTEKPWKKYLDAAVSGSSSSYSVFVGEVAGGPDPDTVLYPTFHENAEGLTNGIFYHDEAVMEQLTAARRTTDHATRRDRYESVSRSLLEDRVYVPLCSLKNSFAHSDAVGGFEVHPIAQSNPRLVRPSGTVRVDT